MSTYTEAQILAIGGSPWARGTKRRVYLSDWQSLTGLKLDTYGSGSVQSAEFDGAPISNAEALRLCGAVGRVWWDAADGQIHTSQDPMARYGPGSPQAQDMARRLAEGIAAAVARTESA